MNIFYFYFLEIKSRVLLLLLAWVSTIVICYSYKEMLLFSIVKFNDLSNVETAPLYFIFTNITEMFSIYIKLLHFIANQIFLIYFLYHILLFIAPGLYHYEYKCFFQIFSLAILFWVFSIYLLNNFFLPICWNFFISFQNLNSNFYFEAKLNEYLNFYLTLYYICNISCQFFMILIFFFNSLKGNLYKIKQLRKVLYLFFICFATIATPPDIISQLILFACLVCIFELLIFSMILKTCLI